MANWTYKKNGGSAINPATSGLQNLRLQFFSMDTDIATVEQRGPAFDGTPLFADGDAIAIYNTSSVCIFQGAVRDIEAIGTPGAEGFRYRILGPWDWLKTLVFQQQWNFATDLSNPSSALALQYVSKLVLGWTHAGVLQNIGQIVTEIVNYAITECSAPLALATFTEATQIPSEQCNDLRCEGALRRVLRWLPDTVTWFDYTTSPPTLHFQRAASATTKSLTIPPAGWTAPSANPDNLAAVPSVRPRNDLQVPSVVLRYIAAGSTVDNGWNTIAIDKAPGGATGFERKALVATLDLIPGRPEVALNQLITVRGMLTAASDLTISGIQAQAVALVQEHFPLAKASWISNLHVDSILIETADGSTINASCVNELVNGTVTPWMKSQYSILTQVQKVTFTVSCTNSSYKDGSGATMNKKFTAIKLAPKTFLATNALNQNYRYVTESAVIGESPPSGLATTLYNALSALTWAGEVSQIEQEWSGELRPGLLLSFTGGNSGWTTLGALIQRVDVNIDTGESTATFGPPEHLGPQDLLERLRLGRDRAPPSVVNNRVNGTDGSPDQNQDLGTDHPHPASAEIHPALMDTGGALYSGDPSIAHTLVMNEVQMYVPGTGCQGQLAMVSAPYNI